MTLKTRPLTEKDISIVSDIHSSVFIDTRSTRLGKPFLKKMYRWFLENQSDLSLVAEYDDQIIGFVVGAKGGYGRQIFKYAFFEIILGFVLHPNLLIRREMFNLWQSYIQSIIPFTFLNFFHASTNSSSTIKTSLSSSNSSSKIKASLSSIGVINSSQGKGFGKKLIEAFEQLARNQDVEVLSLSVLKNNIAARRLYESCGWKYIEENSPTESAYYIKYLDNRLAKYG